MKSALFLLPFAVVAVLFADCGMDRAAQSRASANVDFESAGADLMRTERLGELQIGMPLAEVLRRLGQPDEKTIPEMWGADGEYHQTHLYRREGLELDYIGETEKNLNGITATADCRLKTSRGIGIGSGIKAVQKAYRQEINPEESGEGALIAGSIFGGLIFSVEQGRVVSIFLGAGAE